MYGEGEQFRTYRNPDLLATKEARKAKLILAGVLCALPISLLACLVSVSDVGSPDVLPSTVVSNAPESALRNEVVLGTERWLEDHSYPYASIIWNSWQESARACQPIVCETHSLTVVHGGNLPPANVEVTIDPESGATSYYLEPGDLNLLRSVNDNPPSWASNVGGLNDLELLPRDFDTTLERWVAAWVSNDQRTLQVLSNAPEEGGFAVYPLGGWEYVFDTVERLSSQRLWDTADLMSMEIIFDVRLADASTYECSPAGSDALRPVGRECAVPQLPVSAELLIRLDGTLAYIIDAKSIGSYWTTHPANISPVSTTTVP